MVYIYDKVKLQFNMLKPKHFLIAILILVISNIASFVIGYTQSPKERAT